MRPIAILYILGFYVIFQFCWWAWLLIELNAEVYQHRIELVQFSELSPEKEALAVAELQQKISQRRYMVIGEGLVFLSLLLWGGIVTYRSFRREYELARLQKNFLLSVTHEFKSPLASIKLYLQTLQRHDLDPEKQKTFIQSAVHDTDRLNNLVENALLANLIDHQGYFFGKEEVNLSALIRLLLQKYQSLPGHHRVEAKIDEGVQLTGDKNALSILFNNLLENAAKYAPKDSVIRVELTKLDHSAILKIIDEGIGVPDAEKQKIFRKFYRVGNELVRKTKGTGLGLYLAQYIAEKHHGKISVRDNMPKGAVFEVLFRI